MLVLYGVRCKSTCARQAERQIIWFPQRNDNVGMTDGFCMFILCNTLWLSFVKVEETQPGREEWAFGINLVVIISLLEFCWCSIVLTCFFFFYYFFFFFSFCFYFVFLFGVHHTREILQLCRLGNSPQIHKFQRKNTSLSSSSFPGRRKK